MKKQNDFNMDMERYLVKQKVSKDINKKQKKDKKEKSVIETHPELDDDDEIKVHIISKESKIKIAFSEYKKKILKMLRSEEKKIEEMEPKENGEELSEEVEDLVEDVEEIIDSEEKKSLTFSERFKRSMQKMFGKKEVLPEEYEIDPETGQEVEKDAIEEEFEEEMIDEELQEKKKFKSWFKRIFGGNEEEIPEELDEDSENYDEKKITKLVLYKPKIEKDIKLALMIADKHLNDLPDSKKDAFLKSGDKKDFDHALKKLKLK